jgi:hypothetical protein
MGVVEPAIGVFTEGLAEEVVEEGPAAQREAVREARRDAQDPPPLSCSPLPLSSLTIGVYLMSNLQILATSFSSAVALLLMEYMWALGSILGLSSKVPPSWLLIFRLKTLKVLNSRS